MTIFYQRFYTFMYSFALVKNSC